MRAVARFLINSSVLLVAVVAIVLLLIVGAALALALAHILGAL